MPAASRADGRFDARWTSPYTAIALLALIGIAVSLIVRVSATSAIAPELPLLVVLAAGGGPLVLHLAWRGLHGDFGSDHLAAVSIAASVLLHEYLAGVIVVLMLAGGNTLEQFAVAQAASVLRALARRLPTIAHRRRGGQLEDVPIAEIAVGDELTILPFDICPVDGEVIAGHGAMDESYLTGEPFLIAKGPGTAVLFGAINGESALTIRDTRVAGD